MQSAVYATEVSMSEYLCYTTEESEKMEVLERARNVGSMARALRELAREKTEGKTIKKTENHE